MPAAVDRQHISYPPTPAVTSRKRTMSFSSPQPLKSARTPLRRTGSFLSLADMQSPQDLHIKRAGSPTLHLGSSDASVPYNRSLRHYKEQRDRRKSVVRTSGEAPPVFTVTPIHTPTPVQAPLPRQRATSPLSPQPDALPPRTHFPRSKPEPDLYRVAITARMRLSPQGQKILHMGPRLALSIHTATLELERIVASHRDSDGDISMSNNGGGETLLSTSWVVVPPEDWEMIDGGF